MDETTSISRTATLAGFTAADSDVDLLCRSVCFLTFERPGDGLLMRCPIVVARCAGCAFERTACWRICDVSQGTIKKLTDKGFGFIQGDNGDIFFHSSSVEGTGFDSLYEGQAVQYNEGNGPKGKRAENVRVS